MVDIELTPEQLKLKEKLEKQLKSIPTPHLDKKEKKSVMDRVRERDRKNFEHQMKILKDRKDEAIEFGDRKQKYAAIAVASDQKGQYRVRSQLSEMQNKYDFIKKTIPEEEYVLMEPLIEFNEEINIEGDFSERELHKYFKDEFQINPKYIIKLIELIKLKRKINELEKLN